MNVSEITKKLVSIPSYRYGATNENKIGNFIFEYLKQYDFFEVKKQMVEKNRYNIIASTKGRRKLLLAGHMDTVEPKQGCDIDQYKGVTNGDKLYGLGSCDMKGGIASILSSIDSFRDISGLTLLFYCDEEYDFKGMRKFLADENKGDWDLALIPECSNLEIWNSHRGIIEITFAIEGKAGHAANPKSGKNAISGIMSCLREVKARLSEYEDSTLGQPSLNIAYINGGLNLGVDADARVKLAREGNIIADYAEAVIDIRTTDAQIKADKVISWIKKNLSDHRYKLLSFSVRHDLGSLHTLKKDLAKVEKIYKKSIGVLKYSDPATKGYGDGQMIHEKFHLPVIYIGPKGGSAHGKDEWVSIRSLNRLSLFMKDLIEEYCLVSK